MDSYRLMGRKLGTLDQDRRERTGIENEGSSVPPNVMRCISTPFSSDCAEARPSSEVESRTPRSPCKAPRSLLDPKRLSALGSAVNVGCCWLFASSRP